MSHFIEKGDYLTTLLSQGCINEAASEIEDLLKAGAQIRLSIEPKVLDWKFGNCIPKIENPFPSVSLKEIRPPNIKFKDEVEEEGKDELEDCSEANASPNTLKKAQEIYDKLISMEIIPQKARRYSRQCSTVEKAVELCFNGN